MSSVTEHSVEYTSVEHVTDYSEGCIIVHSVGCVVECGVECYRM